MTKPSKKLHPNYLYSPDECTHKNLETIGGGKGCYDCGVGFHTKPLPFDFNSNKPSKKTEWKKFIIDKAEKYVRGNGVYYGNETYMLAMSDWLYFIKGCISETIKHSLHQRDNEIREKIRGMRVNFVKNEFYGTGEELDAKIKFETAYNSALDDLLTYLDSNHD